jgi:ABC-type amino acid transport substrate-binding protein
VSIVRKRVAIATEALPRRRCRGYTIVGSVGIGVRKSDGEFLKKINASLAKLKADGRLEKILAKSGLA